MNAKGRRLANILSRLLAVLTAISALGLIILVPTTLFAVAMPDLLATNPTVHAGALSTELTHEGAAALVLLLGIGFVAVMLVVLIKLRQIMKTVASGTPFAVDNIARLRAIAAAMAVLLVGQILTGFVLPARLREAGQIHGGFNAGLFLAILVVLVLAEVFREGARLHDDVEGTI